MYYLIPDEKNRATIYAEKPAVVHLEVESIPAPLPLRPDMSLCLFANLETGEVWWDYEELPEPPAPPEPEPGPAPDENQIWTEMAQAIREGVNLA